MKHDPVLVLSSDTRVVDSIGFLLKSVGLEVFSVSKARDAILKLRERPFDMIIVDSALKESDAIDFLAKARQFLPFTLRAVYEESAGALNPRSIVNQAGLSAIYTGSIDVAHLTWLLDHQAPSCFRSGKDGGGESPAVREKSPEPVAVRLGQPSPYERPTSNGHSKQAVVPETSASAIATESVVDDEMAFHPDAPDQMAEASRVLALLFERPDIRLPVLPQVAMEVQKLIAREDSNFEQIADKVVMDQSMSARILEVANSPLYAGVEQIRSLPHAVSRIGLRETRNILQVVAAENLFKTRDKRIATRMATLWMHGLACAYSNEILAKALSIQESQDFFMMGFLHDIGKLLIIHLVDEGYRMNVWTPAMMSESLLDGLLRTRHNEMGLLLVRRWGYPESFNQVIEFHNDDEHPQEHDEAVVVTYFSNLLTRKMGLSLEPHEERLLDRRELAQSLNMSQKTRAEIEVSLAETIEKIKSTFRRKP